MNLIESLAVWAAMLVVSTIMSKVLNQSTISMIMKKPNKTFWLSLLAGLIGWAKIYVIGGLMDWNKGMMASETLGDAIGDWWEARRKKKEPSKGTKAKAKKRHHPRGSQELSRSDFGGDP